VRAEAQHVPKVSGSGGGNKRIVLGIASPKGGCGKTTIALNLSLSFARQGRSVILVDTDIIGDVLSSIQAREKAEHGAFDVLLGAASPSSALLRTVLPNFRIMPAVGQNLPDPGALAADQERAWHQLIGQLSEEAEMVIIDMPAGMFGTTLQIATRCTHLLGVLQAELIASRSFAMFKRTIELIPRQSRPEIAGVVLNMLQTRQTGSVHVLQDACSALPRQWLLDTAIPRSDAFLQATVEGLPLRLLDDSNPPAVSWLFDTLASELTDRLALHVPERQARRLLL
jgi:chromosome partitioning protein